MTTSHPSTPAPGATDPRPRRRARAVAPVLALTLLVPAAVTLTALGAAASPDRGSHAAVPAGCPWMDTRLSPDERARLLLDASSLQQKMRWLVEQPANSPTQTDFSGVSYPAQLPCTPTVVYTDGPDGVRFTEGVTAFPAPIALAATWDTELAYDKGAAQAAEAFDKGKNVVLGPGIAAGRTPLSGRTPEYLGEDPVLMGALGAAVTRGIQQGDPARPVLANIKHYVGNEQELDRQTSNSVIDQRTLRELYDLPFEIIVAEGEPESIMCSYNQVNGAYGCENTILREVLKDELGFDGYVMSDFRAVHSTAPSLNAGLDQELNRPVFFTPAALEEALAAGTITAQRIDEAAFRVVRSYIRGGLFDRPLPATPVADASTPEHKAIARRMAAEGTVLLKNDGVLPLAGDGLDVALIGPTASSTPTNGVDARTACSMTWRFGGNTLLCEDVVSAETALAARLAELGGTLTFDDGSDPAAAARTAAAADVAVVVGYRTMGEFADLADLSLENGGDALVSAVAAANPSTVVVLQTGSATDMPWLDDVSAVLQTWYPGEQQGPALADVLWGDTNPSGKLPMTFPRSLADTPTRTPEQYPGVFADGTTTRTDAAAIRQVRFSEGRQVGYRWYEAQGIDPLFAFGHGLSYTTFGYDSLHVTPKIVDGERKMQVHVRVTNTGERAGTEIAQVYLDLPAEAGQPSRRLVAWQRVQLEPGEREYVHLTLSADELRDRHLLQYWSQSAGDWVTPRGTFSVHVGGSSDRTARSAAFRVR
ncbi:beta-glucosidase [Cellulomonas aerilata]|uniref:Glycosyl hydrolase n=1 Tax=Cellulomonas aerilata TaxID=515326 RepID=A0A512D8Z5_9CELL|nr:glycoside hydrolase family 3 C-terminal domain-containing protein [Cellulomonas aerilata]GEO32956.1 glycosyl hydrolase [Cellulomonas aerilata]